VRGSYSTHYELRSRVVFGQADRQPLPRSIAHLAEQLHIRRDETRLFRLGESQIEAVVNRMVELIGNAYGSARQTRRARNGIEETR